MNRLPSAITHFLQLFRPLFWAEAFGTCALLLTGLLIGEAKFVQ